MPGQWRRAISGVVLAAAMMPCRAAGQAVQVFDEVQARLEPGVEVRVTDVAGRTTRGRVADVSGLSLQLLDDGELRTFDGATLQRIDRLVPDSVTNGVLWGFAIGAGAGFFGTMIAAHSSASLDTLDNILLPVMIAGPVVGAAVGGSVDRSRTASEAVYVRPVSASHRRGFSWRWTAGRFDVSLGIGF